MGEIPLQHEDTNIHWTCSRFFFSEDVIECQWKEVYWKLGLIKVRYSKSKQFTLFPMCSKTYVIEKKYSPNVDKNLVMNLLEHLAVWWRQRMQYKNQVVFNALFFVANVITLVSLMFIFMTWSVYQTRTHRYRIKSECHHSFNNMENVCHRRKEGVLNKVTDRHH
jgi:hypothetical protein